MDTTGPNLELYDNLADLQQRSVQTVGLFAGAAGYAWFFCNLWTVYVVGERDLPKPSLWSWGAAAFLIVSMALSFAFRARRLRVATHILAWGLLGATACAARASSDAASVYLLALPVIFASVLLGQVAFLLVTAVTVVLTLVMEHQILAFAIGSPLVVIVLIASASWLSVHNLRTALAWVWNGYEQARLNEQIARDRAADLQRALKALDQATYRLERTNYMLSLARDQAQEARRLKQQFAQTISHELRTPLNLIVGFTELMAETPEYYGMRFAPAFLRDLGIIYRNAHHLQDLVNDVLDLARIEAAQLSILPEEVVPLDLVQEAIDTVRSLVESHGLSLHAEIESGLPTLRVDPLRIRQVLFNLITNAVRFTDQGGVTVRVYQEDDHVIFAVSDTGVGIAPQDLGRIFDEFQQADGSTRRRHEGAGLGLAVSKQFVELHGGRIWADSQLGKGSTFCFGLPITSLDWTEPELGATLRGLTSRSAQGEGGEQPVLLVVTRSPSGGALLARYVRGCRTLIVSDLEAARNVAREVVPQVVVIDRASTRIDEKRLDALARGWDLEGTPFVAIPLPGEESLRQKLVVEGYLVKPVSRRTVWDVMRQFGENVSRVLIIEDDQDFVRLLSRILQDSPVRRYQVGSVRSGRQALIRLRQSPPDLILLDLGLPDIDGSDLIELVRSNAQWAQIPVVVVSAQEEIDRRQALAGVAAFTKADGFVPVEIVEWVQQAVNTALRSLPATATSREAPASIPAFPETP